MRPPTPDTTTTPIPELLPEERLALRVARPLTVSQWADRHRVMTERYMTPKVGPWDTSWSEYLREPMDAMSDPAIAQVTLMFASQSGKTEALLNYLGWIIDRDPGPTMVVLPRDEDLAYVMQRRIRVMVEDSPRLARYLSGRKTDNKTTELSTMRMSVFMASAQSPAALASKPIRHLILDEVDKYPLFAGREAGPIHLARERTKRFWDAKVVIASTPTTRLGAVWEHWEDSDQRRYHVPCIHCGEFQVLDFSRVRWGLERQPDKIEAEKLARYHCAFCDLPWTDADKVKVVRRGRWVPASGSIDRDGVVHVVEERQRRGYQLSSLYPPDISFSRVAAQFLRAKDSADSLLNFTNSWLGWIFEERSEGRTLEHLRACIGPHLKNELPEWPRVCVLGGADVQKDGIFYVIRAFAGGDRSALLECGKVANFDLLEDVMLRRVWRKASSGEPVPFGLLGIDAGYRTDEVYAFARKHLDRVRAVRGSNSPMGRFFSASRIDIAPNGKQLKGGITALRVDTRMVKDKLSRLIRPADAAEPKWRIHVDAGEDYQQALCSEHRVVVRSRTTRTVREEWLPRPGGGPNHFWDCEVYCLTMAELVGCPQWEDPIQTPEEVEAKAKRVAAAARPRARAVETAETARERREEHRRPGSWIHGARRRGGWL